MLKRCFSVYPYIQKPSNLLEILQSFPIAFGSPVIESEKFYELLDPEEIQGVTKVYEFFLNSIANNTLQDLEGALEFNFLKKIDRSLKDLHAHGYKLKQTGDIKNTEIYFKKISIFSGSVLPFRNLIMPLDLYQYSIDKSNSHSTAYSILAKYKYDPTLKYDQFENFDFEAANKDIRRNHSPDIQKFFNIHKRIFTCIENHEYIVCSDFKLVVVDQDGKVVSGNDNNEAEMHSVILETFRIKRFFKFFFRKSQEYNISYYTRKMGDYLDQKLLTDFDGFLNGNPPVPRELLSVS